MKKNHFRKSPHTKVSIVMPIFNGEPFIQETLKSIFSQTYRHYELIIINDGSKDNTKYILKKIKNSRIRILTNTRRKGVAKSLNSGIRIAEGEYIARMDADDICHPKRLALQVAFLQKNPSVGVVGTFALLIDAHGKEEGSIKLPSRNSEIKSEFFTRNVMIHPSVMIRSSLFKKYGLYDSSLEGAEDYDLWLRFNQHTAFHNLPYNLLSFRRSKKSISYSEMKRIQRMAIVARIKAIKHYGYSPINIVYLTFPLLGLLTPSFMSKFIYKTHFHFS